MARTTQETIFVHQGRPCMVVGEAWQQRVNPKWGSFKVVRVRFIDGNEPRLGMVGRRQFERCHVLKGAQADYWRKVDDLIEHDGTKPEDARRMALQ